MRTVKQTFKGSPDGAHAYVYEAGQSYDETTTPALPPSLEAVADENGWLKGKPKAKEPDGNPAAPAKPAKAKPNPKATKKPAAKK